MPTLSSTIPTVLAAASLIWQSTTFLMTRSDEAKNKEFEAYHRLIKEIVQPDGGATYVARQCAALFELRRFEQYSEITARILEDLKQTWVSLPPSMAPVTRELQATLDYIQTAR